MDEKTTTLRARLEAALAEHARLGVARQVDYGKFYLYSLITHSTAIEGSTVTELENRLLFDEGLSPRGRNITEQMMNLDLKNAYEKAMRLARDKTPLSVPLLCGLSGLVMKNTGSEISSMAGTFDSSKGELRKVNVTAGAGGKSYLSHLKVKPALEEFCRVMRDAVADAEGKDDPFLKYAASFDAHYGLVTIHPWVDGNGRMARLLMNLLQFRFGLPPARVNKEDKDGYIGALVESRETDSLLPFRAWMMEEHVRNLEKEIGEYKLSTTQNPMSAFRKGR